MFQIVLKISLFKGVERVPLMDTIIGIDVGGSTTKIIGVKSSSEDGGRPSLMSPLQVKANDPKTSIYGAFGRYISENGMEIGDVSRIMITGVGATFIKENIYGIRTVKVEEFDALGLGGLFLSGLDNAVIISMGTGTAFIKADKSGNRHIGGTGVGGGTLVGLSSKLLDMRHFESIVNLAEDGDLAKIDLTIGDISKRKISTMTETMTASNFGKLSDNATRSDIAKGIINMIFQTIGVLAAFACKIDGTKDAVLCGNLAKIPSAMDYFGMIREIHGIDFHLPEYAEYATAIGATLWKC